MVPLRKKKKKSAANSGRIVISNEGRETGIHGEEPTCAIKRKKCNGEGPKMVRRSGSPNRIT